MEGHDRFADDTLADSRRVAGEFSEELYRLRQVERDKRKREGEQVHQLVSGSNFSSGSAGVLAGLGTYAVIVLGLKPPHNIPSRPGLDVGITEAVDQVRRSLQPRHQMASIAGDKAMPLTAVTSSTDLQSQAKALHPRRPTSLPIWTKSSRSSV